jgi:hypothetical protein
MAAEEFVRDEVSKALTDLQKIAGAFSQELPGEQSVVTLQVIFVVGARPAWRLIETTRFSSGHRRRHMLFFDSLDAIKRAVGRYLAWQHADKQLLLTHMATPAGLPGVTTDWVPSTLFEAFFASLRDSIRRDLCPTFAQSTVPLS